MIVKNVGGWYGKYEITLDGGELGLLKEAAANSISGSDASGGDPSEARIRELADNFFRKVCDGFGEALRQAMITEGSVVTIEAD